MEDYPRTLMELEQRFSSEAACREYLETLRWPQGFICPRCKAREYWTGSRSRKICIGCGYQATVMAGTIFERTRMPLRLWFRAIWWITSQKNGVSALGLQRVLGLGCYRTAWICLHKLRYAMVRPGRDKLSGQVEVDETYLGGLEEGVIGRKIEKKALIAVGAEENGKGIGRIRMCRVKDASAASLHPFTVNNIESGSVIHTDGWEGYSGLDKQGYLHKVTRLRGKKESASELLPRVHRVISLLKRWLMGTHQGAISHEYLDYYLDEFTFRFNRRNSRHRGKLFYRLLQQAVCVEPMTHGQLVKHDRRPKSEMHNI
jgi:transposase-like protein